MENVDILSTILGICFTVIGYFAVRTLSKIDRNQNLLFEQVTNLWKELYLLKGEHIAVQSCTDVPKDVK